MAINRSDSTSRSSSRPIHFPKLSPWVSVVPRGASSDKLEASGPDQWLEEEDGRQRTGVLRI